MKTHLSFKGRITHAVAIQWLTDQFEYELCPLCGGDTVDHSVGIDMFGNFHAFCDTTPQIDPNDPEYTQDPDDHYDRSRDGI